MIITMKSKVCELVEEKSDVHSCKHREYTSN
jgi:hypothetical protein